MKLQKEMKSNSKQPSCKKVCGPKKTVVKKPKWQPRYGCDRRLKAKILNNDNSGEFGAES